MAAQRHKLLRAPDALGMFRPHHFHRNRETMADTAFQRSSDEAARALQAILPLMALDMPKIELAGGSVQCMIAGIHLIPRTSSDVGKAVK